MSEARLAQQMGVQRAAVSATTRPEGSAGGVREFSMHEYLVGIPREKVVSMVMIAEAGDGAAMRTYENRSAVFGGVRIMTERTVVEEAVDNVLRSEAHVVEVGKYPAVGECHLGRQITANDGSIRYNGREGLTPDKVASIRSLLKQIGVTRVHFHNLNQGLFDVIEQMGLQSEETLEAYIKLGGKTSLNTALAEFVDKYHYATIGRFGTNFESLSQAYAEIHRLQAHGAGAYIKFDSFDGGNTYLTGGDGQLAIPYGKTQEEVEEQILEMLAGYGVAQDAALVGVVQLFVAENQVISISSGKTVEGAYQIYEAHTQKQVKLGSAFSADGAVPLADTVYTKELFQSIWPQLARFYAEHNLSGDQNVNLLVLPPSYHALARTLYNQPTMSAIVPIDLNPRPISGTKSAMARYVEETGNPINFANFMTRSIKVDSFYAANPHLIYAVAKGYGLSAGKAGNFSLTSFGKFIPEACQKASQENDQLSCQVFVQNTEDPENDILLLEGVLHDRPDTTMLELLSKQGLSFIAPTLAPTLSGAAYNNLVFGNLKEIVGNGR